MNDYDKYVTESNRRQETYTVLLITSAAVLYFLTGIFL
jgi:hypothetical protein